MGDVKRAMLFLDRTVHHPTVTTEDEQVCAEVCMSFLQFHHKCCVLGTSDVVYSQFDPTDVRRSVQITNCVCLAM